MSTYGFGSRSAPMSHSDMAKQYRDAGRKAGFHVDSVETYPDENDSRKVRTFDRIWFDTPYKTERGARVMGSAHVPSTPSSASVKSDWREVTDVEMWTVDENNTPMRNLEDVYEEEYGTRDWHVYHNGKALPMDRVVSDVKPFVSASAELPHVMMFDEYMRLTERNFDKLKLGPVPADSYQKYLDSCEQQLLHKDIEFIGKVTKISDLHIAEETDPGFAEGFLSDGPDYE